jgi:hypothetical protein
MAPAAAHIFVHGVVATRQNHAAAPIIGGSFPIRLQPKDLYFVNTCTTREGQVKEW